MNKQSLTLEKSYSEHFNLFTYPIMIVNDDNYPLWFNKKMRSFIVDGITTQIKLQKLLTLSLSSDELILQKDHIDYYYQPFISRIKLYEKKYYLVSLFNISKRKELQYQLKEEHAKFKLLSENLPESIVLEQDKIVYSNPTFEKLVGLNGKKLLNKKLIDIIASDNQSLFQNNITKLLSDRNSVVDTTLKLLNSKNKIVWVRIRTKKIQHNEEYSLLHIITDISDEKLEIDNLNKLAYLDTLTGLYNRRKFNELLKLEYARSRRFKRNLSALFFDIDHFKKVNDTYGHETGDIVLESLANIVKQLIRETDYFARWGGEEFIILLPETSIDHALELAQRIRKEVETHNFPKVERVSISIGITLLKEKERSDTFIKRLDNALYKAKNDGRNRCELL